MSIKKVAYEFDPFEIAGVEAPRDSRTRAQILSDVADYVRDEVLQYVGEGKSPVAGGPWKKSLSPDYKEFKKKEGGSGFANMELTGDMLDSLEVVDKRGGKLSLQIEGSQAPKADGHNNHSGDSSLPERRFIPKPNEEFNSAIKRGIKEIVKNFLEE